MFGRLGIQQVEFSLYVSLYDYGMRCPSSVCRARLVTAGAIDLKLCTYVPLGQMTSDQISVQSDSWLGQQGSKTENTKSAITLDLYLYVDHLKMFIIGTSR
jgi:hypothetical protein